MEEINIILLIINTNLLRLIKYLVYISMYSN